MTSITKHHSKQEWKREDSVRGCNRNNNTLNKWHFTCNNTFVPLRRSTFHYFRIIICKTSTCRWRMWCHWDGKVRSRVSKAWVGSWTDAWHTYYSPSLCKGTKAFAQQDVIWPMLPTLNNTGWLVTHTHMHIHMHTHPCMHTHTHTHTQRECWLTRVDLLVGGHTVGINNGLKCTSELVDLVVGWRLLTGLHAIQDRRNGRTTTLLYVQ